MITQSQKNGLQAIIEEARNGGFVKIDRWELNQLFPPPDPLSRSEIEEMVSMAIALNIKPPPEEPTQEEKIKAFCEENNLLLEDNGWQKYVTFRAKGMIPKRFEDITRKRMEDCRVGDIVHENDVPEHARGGMFAQCLPLLVPDPCWYGTEEMTKKVLATPMMFQRQPMFNGESCFQRIS